MQPEFDIVVRKSMFCLQKLTSVVDFEGLGVLIAVGKNSSSKKRLAIQWWKTGSGNDCSGEFILGRGCFCDHQAIKWDSSSFLVNHSLSILRITVSEKTDGKIVLHVSQKFNNNFSGTGSNEERDISIISDDYWIRGMLKLSNEYFLAVDNLNFLVFSVNHPTVLKKFSADCRYGRHQTTIKIMKKSKLYFPSFDRIICVDNECSAYNFDENNLTLKKFRFTKPTSYRNFRKFYYGVGDFDTFIDSRNGDEILVVIQGYCGKRIRGGSIVGIYNTTDWSTRTLVICGTVKYACTRYIINPRCIETVGDKYVVFGSASGIVGIIDLREGYENCSCSTVFAKKYTPTGSWVKDRINDLKVVGMCSSGIEIIVGGVVGADVLCLALKDWGKRFMDEDFIERTSYCQGLVDDENDGERGGELRIFSINIMEDCKLLCFASLI